MKNVKKHGGFKVGDRVTIVSDKYNYSDRSVGESFIISEMSDQEGEIWAREKTGDPSGVMICSLKLKEEAMWDDKTVEAIKESVEHWEENVKKTIDGNLALDDYQSDYCTLCNRFGSAYCASNNDCPLNLRGMKCSLDGSPWDNFNENNTVKNARNMVLALKSLFYPEEEKKEVFYSIGQRFINNSGTYVGDEYILCRHSSDVAQLTHLLTGERWSTPREVEDDKKITEKEFRTILNGATFTLKESK